MTRDEAIQQGVAAIQQGLSDAIGGAFDAGLASAPPSGVSPDQEASDIAAVKAADAQALQDAQTKASNDLAALQANYDALSTKETGESKIISGLENNLAGLQESFARLSALVSAVLTPPPADPQPTPPAA